MEDIPMDVKPNSENSQRFEILVGLHVSDEAGYDQYRAGMTPILEEHGGYFSYDFRVSDILIGESDDPLNRVFILSFPDKLTQEQFFSNKKYKDVRAKYFEPAVKSGGVIASYSKFYKPTSFR
jgi:uncharacterized protein (DUF1330 family)